MDASIPVPRLVQIALCSNNVPRSFGLFTKVFGFADAGSHCLLGRWSAEVQELGDDAAGHITWVTGRQDFMQLELFHHTDPPQRPLAADWRPSDHGYGRWGLAISDFDGCLTRLAEHGVETITEPQALDDGVRRVCFRDPYSGAIVEVLEDGPNVPGGVRPKHFSADPAILYAALSVADLEPSRAFFGEALGLQEQDPTFLHAREMEALWGLEGAEASRIVYDTGGTSLEISCYRSPAGRPKPADYRLSDQGVLNIAFGYRTRDEFDTLIAHLEEQGYSPVAPVGPAGAPTCAYLRTNDYTSVEFVGIPAEFNAVFGFEPCPTIHDALGSQLREELRAADAA